MSALVAVKLDYAYPQKIELLEALYAFLEEEAQAFGFVCQPGCHWCCTTHLWTTSLEAQYLQEVLRPENQRRFLALKAYPRPGTTPNTLALYLMQGREPPPDQEGPVETCPLLSREDRCLFYARRPLVCRVMYSRRPCSPTQEAEVPPEFLGLSSLLFQLVEELDVGGVYGHLVDNLRFLAEPSPSEVPEYLLGNREAPDLAYQPQEDYLRKALSRLYRRALPSGKTFKEKLDEIKASFGPRERLTFLDEIF